ncbi:hypothetical protein HK100_005895 [Physocladia obscura]|uniref:Uncharacterized protein n=1 Tax=Physocladia obscura TaxID=109957 RepID=A0AAD5XFC6_9FUNG|nr:hypothetical protein HK100_005895 [Physocladia obscura]
MLGPKEYRSPRKSKQQKKKQEIESGIGTGAENGAVSSAEQYSNIDLGNGNSKTTPSTNTIGRTVPRQSGGIDPEDNLDAVMRGINQRRQRREDEYIKTNGPRIRYNSLGQVIDGGWTKDKVLRRWGDAYHHAGLFQVCGTADIQFNPEYSDSGGAGNLTIKANSSHPLTCVSVEEYINNFMILVQPNASNPQPSDRFYDNAQDALAHIVTSRWLEGVGTVLDMIFGIGSLLLVLRPAADERVEARNAGITFAGIFVMPWFPVFDILISFSYWSDLGVGYFAPLSYSSSDSLSNYTLAGPVVSIFTSWFDFTIQILFLAWGLKRLLGANKKQLKHLFIKNQNNDSVGLNEAERRNDQVQMHASGSEVGVAKSQNNKQKEQKQERLFPGPKALGI